LRETRVQEKQNTTLKKNAELEQIMMGIYDFGINVEGVTVLHELKDCHYPPDLMYTFENIQKVLMELESHQLFHLKSRC
uniref:Uncharacterized protein n=1 Tax=Oryzias latipes TaxID=8090 RepID=A0A3P9IZX3_ORYLA